MGRQGRVGLPGQCVRRLVAGLTHVAAHVLQAQRLLPEEVPVCRTTWPSVTRSAGPLTAVRAAWLSVRRSPPAGATSAARQRA